MRVIELKTKRQLKKFVAMADRLYRGDALYVPYMRGDLFQTLVRLVRKEKTYTALAVEEDGRYVARLLFTVAPSKQLKLERCGYFSHFECIDSQPCANLIFGELKRRLREQGIEQIEGPYFPYDQDNRRGILVQGFKDEPMILTSYNPPYYGTLLENFGFTKAHDIVSYQLDYDKYDFERIDRVTKRVLERYGIEVSPVDFNNLDQEIDDVHEVIARATTDIIFQEAPTREEISRIVKNWRSFLWPDFIHVARRKEDGKPVGVMMSVPNYFTVFRKMKGKINPVSIVQMFRYKKKIDSVRAMMQYVIPEYQKKGVIFALYHEFYKTCKRRGIVYMEAGTIMENNADSRRNVESASGTLNKIFRIYGLKI
jgi:GNAT superfamily N-acetyltransferase